MHRRDLNTLTPAERTELANMIRNYVTPDVLNEHAEWHHEHGSGGNQGLGSGERFLSFHRNFIGKLEDSLKKAKKEQYVPLPSWNPATPIPQEFFHPDRITSNPNLPLPSWATAAGGIVSDPIFGYKSLAEFVSSDELGRALGYRFHGQVHNAIGGDMATFDSPRDPIFFPWHAFLDDLWSEWEAIPTLPPS